MQILSLLRQLSPEARLTRSAPLAGGVSAEVHDLRFAWPDGQEDRVVARRHRRIEGKGEPGDRAAREHALLQVLHPRGLPVPRSRLFVPPDTLLLDWMDGDTTLPPDAAEALASTLAAIHSIEAAEVPVDLPRLDDPLPELLTWMQPAEVSDLALPRTCSYEGVPRLLHGDFWPGNVLWREGRLVAVLDWEDAASGDPLADVACARVELCCGVRGSAEAERFTEAYARHASIDGTRLALWDLFVSTAALRFMSAWGLPPDALAARQAATTRFRLRAVDRIRGTR